MAPMPPLRRTARSLPIALLRARERVMGPIREILNESGISEQKFRVLRVVEESGPMEQTALAQQACLLLPSLTRMLRAGDIAGAALYFGSRAGAWTTGQTLIIDGGWSIEESL